MFVPFIISLLVSGILCENSEDCIDKERYQCDSFIPKRPPSTAEDLRSLCVNQTMLGNCLIGVYEACEYASEATEKLRKTLEYRNKICDEDNAIYKVISSNVECIGPVLPKMEDACNLFEYSEENLQLALRHAEKISANSTYLDMPDCLFHFWYVSCRTIVVGVHCGSEAEEAVGEILRNLHEPYQNSCGEVLEEIQPLYETFHNIIEAEQALKNAVRK